MASRRVSNAKPKSGQSGRLERSQTPKILPASASLLLILRSKMATLLTPHALPGDDSLPPGRGKLPVGDQRGIKLTDPTDEMALFRGWNAPAKFALKPVHGLTQGLYDLNLGERHGWRTSLTHESDAPWPLRWPP